VGKIITANSRKIMATAPGTVDFIPPKALDYTLKYGPPMYVFFICWNNSPHI